MQRLERFTNRFFNRKAEASDVNETSLKPNVEGDPSEDIEFLLAPGKIEELVRESRTPLKIGTIEAGEGAMQPYYQVPPRGYNPEEIDHIYMSPGGAYSFVHKDGSQRIGSTYTLTEEQAQLLESRVAAEREKLGQI